MHALEVIVNQNEIINQANVCNKYLQESGYQEISDVNPHLYSRYHPRTLAVKRHFKRVALSRHARKELSLAP